MLHYEILIEKEFKIRKKSLSPYIKAFTEDKDFDVYHRLVLDMETVKPAEPLRFLLDPHYPLVDFMSVNCGNKGFLCSTKLLHLLLEHDTPRAWFPVHLFNQRSGKLLSEDYILYCPHTRFDAIDWSTSAVTQDALTGKISLRTLHIPESQINTLPFCFYHHQAYRMLVRANVQQWFADYGITGVELVPLEAFYAPHGWGVLLRRWQERTSSHPTDAQAWSELSITLKILNQFELAIDASEHALALRPNDAEMWMMKGDCLGYLDQWTEAAVAYAQALQQKEKNFLLWQKNGDALFQCGRLDEALVAAQTAISLHPFTESWYTIGRIQYLRGNREECYHVLKEGLKYFDSSDGFGHMFFLLATVCLELDKAQEALDILTKGLTFFGLWMDLWQLKKQTLQRLGRVDEVPAIDNKMTELLQMQEMWRDALYRTQPYSAR